MPTSSAFSLASFASRSRPRLLPHSSFIARSRRLAILAVAALALTACGGGGGGSGGFDGGGTVTTPGGSGGSNTQLNIGFGTGSAFQDGVINASETTVASGQTVLLRVNVVGQGGTPPSTPQTVRFSSPCATGGRATLSDVSEVAAGLFSVNYTNSGCDGPDLVTATLVQNSDSATVTLNTVGPQVLSVSFVSSTLDQLSLAGIGGNESTELTFKVSGPQGVPVIGTEVGFSINSTVGGASILPGRESGLTDQQGLVRTVLNGGTVPGPVNVLAVHKATGRQGLSSDIIISTGVPEASRFSMSYGPFNPKGAFNTDGVTVTINLIASDAFGNNPTDGTRVSFVSPESGNVQNSCLLVDGACSVTWRSSSPRPADGRLEILAYTDGAERFVDTNGNSVYDNQDGAIQDLGEPYADENEDGTYNLGEYFFDTNHHGVRDGGNGLWDGPCLVKVDPSANCSGNDTVTIYSSVTIVMSTNTPRIYSLGTFPQPGVPISIVQGQVVSLQNMVLADNNVSADALGGNPLPQGTTVNFAIEGPGVTLQGITSDTIGNTTSPTGFYGATLAAAPVAANAELPTGTRLVLNITVPGEGVRQFAWPVVVLREAAAP